MSESESLRCPVCRARFPEEGPCRRCGANLTHLRSFAAMAYVLRQRAESAFRQGHYALAALDASRARQLHATDRGRLLSLLADWAVRRRLSAGKSRTTTADD